MLNTNTAASNPNIHPIGRSSRRLYHADSVSAVAENRDMTIAVRDDVQEMSSCLDNLRATLNGLDDNGITHTLRDIETISRKTHLLMLETVAEAEARGLAAREGFGNTARPLATMLRLSATEARARVELACAVSTRRTITGETLPPRPPATAAELGAGASGRFPHHRWRAGTPDGDH